MIVKDEAHIIVQTLTHLTELLPLDYWVISDTGSTDGTQDLIRTFFAEKQIPGELHEDPWKNFGHNRSLALKHAYNKTDYVIVWDADDYCVGKINLPSPLQADCYYVTFGTENGFRYVRNQIFKNRKRWKYVGVLHEYPDCEDPFQAPVTIRGDYYIVSGRSGNRNKDPKKYQKDAEILEQGLIEEPNNTRYVFYCANSYNHAKMYDEAIEKYKKALTMNTWSEEKYISCLELYDIYDQQKKTPEKALHWLLESIKYNPLRVECIYRLVRYYSIFEKDDTALSFYSLVANYYENAYLKDDVSRFLFARKQEYDFFLPYYVSISALRQKKYDLVVKMFRMIFRTRYLYAPVEGILWIYKHLQTLTDVLPMEDIQFLDDMLEYKTQLHNVGFQFGTDINTIVRGVIDKYRNPLIQIPSGAIHPLLQKTILRLRESSTPIRVMFSITTCKRLDLFTKTMNSILRTWKDLVSVDYFLCVDDNSSEEDRKQMRNKYPFFDFVMKTEGEKGHRQSMNIIWGKLQELRPTYWIHMEDDWLFFKADNYVQRSIQFLEKYQSRNIHQILFNRNYTETYEWNIMGGEKLEPGFLLHLKSDSIQGPNSGYWPHYSFRPSMVRTQKILEIGNYDSPNTFFERDYADRYFAKGYKSAFFDTIVSLHIGKLTSDRSGTNAYTLNKESQFGSQNTFVVNLKRRPDRRTAMETLFKEAGVQKYEFYEAVDGKSLVVTDEIVDLFQGNDFGDRCGVIGCALSHYRLWQRLVADPQNEYYIIFEDDITLCNNFSGILTELQCVLDPTTLDVLFLGYHTRTPQEKMRTVETGKYVAIDLASSAGAEEFLIPRISGNLAFTRYIGGTFGYIVTKQGAQNYLRFIETHGIKHGIDYLAKIIPGFRCKNIQPHMVFSDWVQTMESTVDSDIQKDRNVLTLIKNMPTKQPREENDWVFFEGVDSYGGDISYVTKLPTEQLMDKASQHPACMAFNTQGYLKYAVKFPLEPSNYVRAPEGIYVRRSQVPSEYMSGGVIQARKPKEIYRVSVVGTDLSGDVKYKNIQLTRDTEPIDYSVTDLMATTGSNITIPEIHRQVNIDVTRQTFPSPHKNRICVIHSYHRKETGTADLDILMLALKTYNLYADVDHVIISNVGLPLQTEKYTSHSKKISILQSSESDTDDSSTREFMDYYSTVYPTTQVLYLQTLTPYYLGVSKSHIQDWMMYMLAFLLEKRSHCYKLLESSSKVSVEDGIYYWSAGSGTSSVVIHSSKVNHIETPYPRTQYGEILRNL